MADRQLTARSVITKIVDCFRFSTSEPRCICFTQLTSCHQQIRAFTAGFFRHCFGIVWRTAS